VTRAAARLGDALEELIDHRGKTPKKLGGDWSRSGIRVISAMNVKNGRVNDDPVRYVTRDLAERWMPLSLKAGDVILTSEAPLGEVAYLTRDVDWCLGQRLFGLRGKPGLLDGRFLYYLLKTGPVRDELLSRATGTTASGIRQAELVKLALDLPPIDEQHSISATLGALDNKIDSNRRIADAALALLDQFAAQAAEVLPLVPLADIAVTLRANFDPASYGEAVIDHFSIPAFDDDQLPQCVPGESIMSNKLLVSQPSVLVSRLNPRTNRTWFAVPEPPRPAGCSTEFMVLHPATGVSVGSLWLAVRSEGFVSVLARRVTGTSGSHQRVRPDDAMGIEVPDVRSLSPERPAEADRLLQLVHQRRVESRRLGALRDALMPGLLSGALRTSPEEEAS
jgi:type I restriction enzyme, S subunit